MDFLLPKMSATMETAVVGKWLKNAGDPVKMGEALVELETDKATLEVESPIDGTVAEIVAETGAELEIGAVLARLEGKGAAAAKPSASTSGAASAAGNSASASATAAASPASKVSTVSPAPPPARTSTPASPARILSSPLARRLAGLHGVELSGLTGSGPNGRIRKRDVMGVVPSTAKPAVATAAQPAPQPARVVSTSVTDFGDSRAEPLSSMRAQIAASVTLSRQTIPSFVLDRWIDTTAVERARALLGAEIEQAGGVKLTFTDFLLQAMADSLGQSPQLLDRYVESGGKPGRVRGSSIDIGLVVAVADGVMIPVIRNLAGKSLAAIATARQAAVQRARSGRLSQADYQPAAISLSNIGKSGADRFEAIIGPGQTSILAVGREHEKVVPRAGAIAISKGVNVTLAADHRLIDGLTGADFLGVLADRMQLGPWSAA